MTSFDGVDPEAASEFAARWLPAWTGNDPARLASFYSDDAFYSDPAISEGVNGKAELTAYFTRLLAHFPDWTWTQTASAPMPGGFLNYWIAQIPTPSQTLEITGVCTVRLRNELIERNEVFFDRSPLLAALSAAQGQST
jgi:hypothetical protein